MEAFDSKANQHIKKVLPGWPVENELPRGTDNRRKRQGEIKMLDARM